MVSSSALLGSPRFWMGLGSVLGLAGLAGMLLVATNHRQRPFNTPQHLNGPTSRLMHRAAPFPLVVNTWAFNKATDKARMSLLAGGSPVDAVEEGCRLCELRECADSIGYGGHPDEHGEVTLDAMIMDGETHRAGSVGCLRQIKHAVSVARAVMDHSELTLLVGELATDFAVEMGFPRENLSTDTTVKEWEKWKLNGCQPNYWRDVNPNPKSHCGPYAPTDITKTTRPSNDRVGEDNHDTIGIIAVDGQGKMAVATSTNGLQFKISGRVGDSPIIGSGGYVDKEVGAAAGTGDGDVLMRFLPSLVTVEQMRLGKTPTEAAQVAMKRIEKYYPDFSGAVVAVDVHGRYGAACHGMDSFPFCVWSPAIEAGQIQVLNVTCV